MARRQPKKPTRSGKREEDRKQLRPVFTTKPESCLNVKMDYIPPPVKLCDDGKWVNESYIQSAFSSSPENLQKHTGEELRSDWTLWEENKALWEENKALQVENRALRKENKALQVFPEINFSLKISPDEVFAEQKKPIPVLQKEKLTVQILGNRVLTVPETSKDVTAQENSTKATQPQAVKAVSEIQEESRTLPVLKGNKTPTSPLEENEAFLTLQKLNQLVLSLFRENQALLEEKETFHTLQGENKTLREENNKLKQQHWAMKKALAQMASAVLPGAEKEIKKPESC
ncbi:UNVERIFIED_CONTAM: hypothetical protein K2H54_005329 [Gekko kuhli]